MKKYTKPMVKLVSLKSSDDIASSKSFKAIKKNLINDYLYTTGKGETYTVSQYSTFASNPTPEA